MPPDRSKRMKTLALVGGGHAHVHVLAALGARPYAATEVVLVSPYPRQIYSGMLPGWIAGHYSLEDCALSLDSLARRAGVRFVQTSCTGLDLDARQMSCANGERIAFDFLSIASGPTSNTGELAGANEYALPIRPIEGFVSAWPGLLEKARQAIGGFRLVIVGDGAAGVELAFAMQARFAAEGLTRAGLTLIGGHRETLSGLPTSVRNMALKLLLEKGIMHLRNRRAVAFFPDHARLEDGLCVPADACLLVTGAAAPRWPASSGLATDDRGFIRVNPLLQSVSHPFVLAAGDVAAYPDARPKSGVFAVRAGPPLAENLRALCEGEIPVAWQAQRFALYLISTGQKHALAAWGGFGASGAWLWRWKDSIDRRFIARFDA